MTPAPIPQEFVEQASSSDPLNAFDKWRIEAGDRRKPGERWTHEEIFKAGYYAGRASLHGALQAARAKGRDEGIEELHDRLHFGVPFGDCGLCDRALRATEGE